MRVGSFLHLETRARIYFSFNEEEGDREGSRIEKSQRHVGDIGSRKVVGSVLRV